MSTESRSPILARGRGARAAVASPAIVPASALADLLELTKPRITLMVVLTTATGYLLGAEGYVASTRMTMTVVGTLLLAAGASALNMVMEREADGRMYRTADRPLPAGRLDVEPAVAFGVLLSLGGLLVLLLLVDVLPALLGAGTLLGYLFVYTPLKKVTPLSTVVGAVPGAMPPLIGWSASAEALDGSGGLILFALLFFWQLPHFFAIAWLYRDDYARGGFAILPVVDPHGARTAAQTVLFTLALVAVSLLPLLVGGSGWLYGGVAVLLGAWFLGAAVRFARTRSRVTARRLMLQSIVYLPLILGVLLVDRLL
jgi:protoheme IX farnesyltransferase